MLRAYWEQRNTLGATERIEIHIDGYSGSPVQLLSNSEGARFRHEEITATDSGGIINPYANRIQRGVLDFFPRIQSQAERDVLTDILGRPPREVEVRWIRDGSLEWTGFANTENLRTEQKPAYFGRIRATDFDILKGEDYPIQSGRSTLIELLADVLNLGLPIETRTSWTHENINEANDFLAQIYAERSALRKFGRSGEEDEAISRFQAARYLADPALLIRQSGGKILVEQISALKNPGNVICTLYDADGLNPVRSVRDLRQNAAASFDGSLSVKTSSGDDTYPAINQGRLRYDHRATVTVDQFPSHVRMTAEDSSYPLSQVIASSGDTRINFLSSSIQAHFDGPVTQATMQVIISGQGMYWNDSAGQWQSAFTANSVSLIEYGSSVVGAFAFRTEPLPLGSGQLFIEIHNAASGQEQATETLVEGIHFDISDPSVPEGSSTAIDYLLTQQGGYTTRYEYPPTWYGDGPTGYAVGALSTDAAGNALTLGGWGRRGGTLGRIFHENLLKEVIDFQRSNTRKLEANLHGDFDTGRVLIYQGEAFYYVGGQYSFLPGRWSVTLFRIQEQLSEADTFQQLIKYTADSSTGSAPPGGGSGGSGGGTASWNRITGKQSTPDQWATETGGDNRYFPQSNNLSEGNAVAMRVNLGLTDGSADLDLRSEERR